MDLKNIFLDFFGKNEKVACFLFKNGIQLPLVYEISKEK